MAFWPRPRPKAAICQRRTPNGNRLDRPDGLSTRVVTGGRARLVSMIRAVFLGMLCASIALPAAADEPAAGGGLIYELKIGAQVHDVPYMWSGFHVERYAADLNLEAMFSPSITFWGGALRPALGATINFNGDTSKAYLVSRWQ